MADEMIKKMAYTLVNYSLGVKAGEWVVVSADTVCLPLVRECCREILRAGGNPSVLLDDTELGEILYKEGSEAQLSFVSPFQRSRVEMADCVLSIRGTKNASALAGIDAKKIALRAKANGEISRIMNRRADSGELRWSLTQYPTQADAQQAGMSLTDYEEFIYGACLLYETDPVAAWKAVRERQQGMVELLNGVSELRITALDTDIVMSVKGRNWVNSDGRHNFPSGEVFSAPVEDSVNGKVRFSFPGIYMAKEIENICLTFKNGEVVDFSADKGEELLAEILRLDEGSRRLGEIAIGTNYGIQRFTKNMLFDEKLGGTVHMALGNAYGECGGRNVSAIHWDMLCDMKQCGKIYADGKLIYENGRMLE